MKRMWSTLIGLILTTVILLFAIACDKETKKEVTVSFITGTEEVIDDITRTVGEAYGELPEPHFDGHNFKGWYTRETGGFDITADTIVTKKEDHSLYARWTQDGTTVVPKPDDSSLEKEDSTSEKEDSSSVEEPPMVDLALGVATQKVATSDVNSYVIDDEGKLWAWGKNDFGQVGDGTYINRYMPVHIITDKKFSFVTAARYNAFAIDTDGGVWSWGKDYAATPTQILPEKKFYKVSTTYYRSYGKDTVCAIEQDGDLWAWGSNFGGLFGDGSFDLGEAFHEPRHIVKNGEFIDVSVSESHVLAVDANNNLWSWGNNKFGCLGRGYSGVSDVLEGGVYVDTSLCAQKAPVKQKFSKVFAAEYFSFAVDTEGKLWGWGNNENGQLGNGEKTKTNLTPLLIDEEMRIAYMEVRWSWSRVLALDTEGKIWVWGYTDSGTSKNIAQTELEKYTLTPIQIMPDVRCSFISARNSHAIAYDLEGELIGWGSDGYGVLATGIGADREIPKKRITETNYTQIAVVSNTVLAIDENGKLWAWGDSKYYGNGVTESGATPVAVMPEKNFLQLQAQNGSVFVIDTEGGLWAWGANSYGRLGDGTKDDKDLPVRIQPDTCFISVSCGQYHTLAIDEDGKIWAWGENDQGELGNGTKTNVVTVTPVCLETEIGFSQVTAGYDRSAAIDTEGKLWVWGNHGLNEGNGKSLVPIQVEKERTFTQVSAGEEHVLALDTQGKLWTWGKNRCGQLGNGEEISQSGVLLAVQEETRFSNVFAYDNRCFAIDSKGNLWSWGEGHLLGDGCNLNKTVPTQIVEGEKFVCVASALNVCFAIAENGDIWSWGKNCEVIGETCGLEVYPPIRLQLKRGDGET